MTSLQIEAPLALANANASEPKPHIAMQYQAGYTNNMDLMRMEAFLLRVVGRRGADALLLRSRQTCGRNASSAALSSGLLRLSADLLSEPIAQRMLQPEYRHSKVFPTD